jgi:hypothetical protein
MFRRSNVVNITLATNSLCNAPDGIISVFSFLPILWFCLTVAPLDIGGGAGDLTFVQGIGELFHVIQGPMDLLIYLGSFLSVQVSVPL